MRGIAILLCVALAGCQAQPTAASASQNSAAVLEAQRIQLDTQVFQEPAPFSAVDQVTVAVLPFEYSENSGARGEFESVYMASALAETLGQSPWVYAAYVSPVPTEAVDLQVEGQILRSEPNAVDVKLQWRRGDVLIFTEQYGIRLSTRDFAGRTSPLRRMWIRPTNELGQALANAPDDASTIVNERVARYLGEGTVDPSDRVVQLFEKAREIEQAKLLQPITQMVSLQVNEVEPAYVTWQKDSTRALDEAARYREEAADARREAADLKKSANSTFAAGLGLTLLSGFASAQSGSQVNSLQMQADMQKFVDISEEREARAREAVAEANHLSQQAQVAFDSNAQFGHVFAESMGELNVTLQGQVYTLVGAVDAQISQLRTIIHEIADQEALAAAASPAAAPVEDADATAKEEVAEELPAPVASNTDRS